MEAAAWASRSKRSWIALSLAEVPAQGLEDDLPVEGGLAREVHDSHAALAELTLDLEASDVFGAALKFCPSNDSVCAGRAKKLSPRTSGST